MKKIQKSNIYVVIPIAKRMYLTGVGVKRGAGWGNIRRRPGHGGCDILFDITWGGVIFYLISHGGGVIFIFISPCSPIRETTQ